MFSFAYPYILFSLFLVPLFYVLFVWARYSRKKKLDKFGKSHVIKSLMPDVSDYKPGLKLSLRLLAIACIIIALARPWGGMTQQSNDRNGIEVVVAVDASNSMLASSTDSPDAPNRMVTSKLLLERLIDNLGNDRVGLIVYAARAYTLIPVSSDFTSAKTFLNSIDPSQLEYQGTNISEAIRAAVESFSQNKEIGKAIILLTDAEELENSDDVIAAVSEAKKKNIQVNVIGVGSQNGGVIPVGNSVLTDASGQVVTTRLNEDLGKKIASVGNGVYVNAANSDALSRLQKQLKNVKRSAMKGSMLTVHEELFPYFCIVALLLLIVDVMITTSKNKWLNKITFFKS